MKKELLEYHRDRKHHMALCLGMTKPDEIAEVNIYQQRLDFHSRAVAWLEGLIEDDGLTASATTEQQIQRENVAGMAPGHLHHIGSLTLHQREEGNDLTP